MKIKIFVRFAGWGCSLADENLVICKIREVGMFTGLKDIAGISGLFRM
jgi:hypothetical protein